MPKSLFDNPRVYRMIYQAILAWCFILISIAQVLAQDQKRKGTFSGLAHVGIATSQIYNDDFGGYNKLGAHCGIGTFTPISDKLTFQLEINYVGKGSRDPADPKKNKFNSYKISPHYIDIPLLLKFYVWKFEFEAGICNGIYLFHTEKDQIGIVPEAQHQWEFTRYEFGGILGINVPIKNQWYGNVRFQHSILPASGKLGFVNGYNIYGGAYNNVVSFCLFRVFDFDS